MYLRSDLGHGWLRCKVNRRRNGTRFGQVCTISNFNPRLFFQEIRQWLKVPRVLILLWGRVGPIEEHNRWITLDIISAHKCLMCINIHLGNNQSIGSKMKSFAKLFPYRFQLNAVLAIWSIEVNQRELSSSYAIKIPCRQFLNRWSGRLSICRSGICWC